MKKNRHQQLRHTAWLRGGYADIIRHTMRERKLQIFISSTYTDLVDERLAAMEAILAAGHIPAAMEQFTPGDESAWDVIKAWIEESDAVIFIIGGRYGSIEPQSDKSYVQLEYEYAQKIGKPYFALVLSDDALEQRVKANGFKHLERDRPEQYRTFRRSVLDKLCRAWSEIKDIDVAIHQKLPQWDKRPDLVGWVRGDQRADPAIVQEMARLSKENNELRAKLQNSDERNAVDAFVTFRVDPNETKEPDVFGVRCRNHSENIGHTVNAFGVWNSTFFLGSCEVLDSKTEVVIRCSPLPSAQIRARLSQLFGSATDEVASRLAQESAFVGVMYLDATERVRCRYRSMPGSELWGRFSFGDYVRIR